MTKAHQEKGNDALKWVEDLYERYKEDQTLILKIEHLCDAAKSRKDFPFCREYVDQAVSSLTGISLASIYNDLIAASADEKKTFEWQCEQISGTLSSERDESSTRKTFVAEFASFLTIYEPLLRQMASMTSVLQTARVNRFNFLVGAGEIAVRIITNDEQSLTFTLGANTARELAEAIQNLAAQLETQQDATRTEDEE